MRSSGSTLLSLCSEGRKKKSKHPQTLQACAYNTARRDNSVFQRPDSASQQEINSQCWQFIFTSFYINHISVMFVVKRTWTTWNELSAQEEHSACTFGKVKYRIEAHYLNDSLVESSLSTFEEYTFHHLVHNIIWVSYKRRSFKYWVWQVGSVIFVISLCSG